MIIEIAGAAAGGLVLGIIAHSIFAKFKGSAANLEAEKIKNDAEKEANHIKREAKVSAKSELLRLREELEEEMDVKRKEISANEVRMSRREIKISEKAEQLELEKTKIDDLKGEVNKTKERIKNKENELQKNISKQIDQLERVADMSRDEAKDILLEQLQSEVRNECGILVRNVLDEAKEKAEREAQKIVTYAIQRYSGNCTYERTSATIPLPNDEMKGRIIGREGRNIRVIEAQTGVSILIDDTPEAVVITCFDPIRKEIARVMLERLIADGRIHPTRIEELSEKIKKDVEDEIYEAGESAVLETGLKALPTQVIKLLGQLKFRYSFSQNVLKHSLETAYFMGNIAAELHLNEQKAKRIGLVHDIGKAVDHEVEGTHAKIGADILKKLGEAGDVINAVASHHEEAEPETPYAILLNACDSLSASRPGARSQTSELYLKRLEELEGICTEFTGVESCFALQAGREVRVVVNPDNIKDGEAQVLARDICQKIESEMNYPGQIKITIIRETRSVEYAK